MTTVLLIGGSGFIGRNICARLLAAGYSVRIASRQHPDTLAPALTLSTAKIVSADVHDPRQLQGLMSGCTAVINLVGILHGTPEDFETAHVALTRKVVDACQQSGIRRYLHMSALGAAPDGPSHYQRSKARAESIVRASDLDWTIFRPSVVFGEDDQFLNLFAQLMRYLPFLPLAGAHSRLQPVWVQDVARAFVAGIERPDLIGKTLSLVGPKVYTLAELAQLAGMYSGHRRPIIALPNWAARLQASAMQILPKPPLSHDNLDSLSVDNVDPAGFPALLGWPASALEDVAPDWLSRR